MAKRIRADDRLAPLTGRSRELDHLKSALHEAATGRGRVVAISGEAGVGKTRLLEELSSYGESCGITVLSACCPDDPGTPPYWPWSEILSVVTSAMERPLLSETLGPSAALVTEAFPSISAALPQAPTVPSSSDTAEAARFRLFDGVTRLLAACARAEPLLLLLDDLHWADEASLKLLVHLCGEIGRMPILLTGTYRDLGFDPGHPLPAAVGALARQRWFSRFPLRGLSEAEARELIVRGIGEGAAQSHAGTIYRLTDGNPLFLTQIIRLLAGDPAAAVAPGGLAVGVREVIALRLSRLSSECNEAITMASVLGTEFAASLLAEAVGPESGPGVVAALDEAVKERLIEEKGEPPDCYRFSHALIRDAVLAGLQPGRRAQLHARVYGILANRRRGDGAGHALELLGHALQGQVVLGPEAAARCALDAGETALRAHAFKDARRHFASGLAALEHHPMDDLKASLTLGSAKARCVLELGHETRGLFERAFGYYETQGNTAKMVEVLTYRFVLPEQILLPLYERVLTRVSDDSQERGRLLASYALNKACHVRAGRRGTPEFAEALRIARLHGDEWLEMRVLWTSVFVDRFRVESSSRECQGRLERADGLARRLGDCHDEIWIRRMMHQALLSRGRVEDAGELARQMRDTAERQGDLLDRLRVRRTELAIAWYRAEWERVRTICTEILEQAPPLVVAGGWHLMRRCEAAYQSGDFAAGREDLLCLLEETREVPRVPAQIFLTCAAAITGASRVSGGVEHLPEAQGFARLMLEIPEINDGKERFAHRVLGEVCVLRGDAAGAEPEYDYFADQLTRTPDEDRPFSPIHGMLGSLAAVRGKLDLAAAHYDDALRVPGNSVHGRAWIEHDFARVLMRRCAAGDEERARILLETCLETCGRVGLVPLAERAREALASLPAVNGRTARLDGLTAREAEVLSLIARGLTNRDIAAELFISTRTVEAHVRNIFDKTGMGNRTEAAAYAIRHDLPGV